MFILFNAFRCQFKNSAATLTSAWMLCLCTAIFQSSCSEFQFAQDQMTCVSVIVQFKKPQLFVSTIITPEVGWCAFYGVSRIRYTFNESSSNINNNKQYTKACKRDSFRCVYQYIICGDGDSLWWNWKFYILQWRIFIMLWETIWHFLSSSCLSLSLSRVENSFKKRQYCSIVTRVALLQIE